MRELAVVALGGILIWFGLSRGGGTSEAAVPDQDGAPDAAVTTESAPSASEPTVIHFPEASSAADSPGTDVQAPGFHAPVDTRRAEVAQATPEPEAEASSWRDEAAQPEVPPAPISSFPDRGRTSESFPSDGGLDFAGGGAHDDLRLPTLLLEAWISEDSAELLTYLQSGDGADLPMARRQLCAAFWEALVGRGDAARERLNAIKGGDGVTTSQLGLLHAALDPPGQRAVPRSASAGRREPLALAMRMMLLEDEARSLVKSREYARGAVAWSDLIQYEVDAPWFPHREVLLAWGKELEKAQLNHRFAAKGSWPSIEEKVLPTTTSFWSESASSGGVQTSRSAPD